MPWREVTLGDTRWLVSPCVEKQAYSPAWRLVLAYRPAQPPSRSIWATTSLQSSSRTDLYVQAERLTDDKLTAVLAEQLG